MTRWLGLWLPVLGVAGAVFTLSHMSRPPRPENIPDWWLHGLEFAALGFVLVRALAGGLRGRPGVRHVVTALVLAAIFALGDEFHQSFIPERDASAGDVLADTAGAAMGIALAVAGSRWMHAAGGDASRGDAVNVCLVTGPSCPLCDDAQRALRRLSRRFPLAIEHLSISDDPVLAERHRHEIPVILVDGRRLSKGRVDEGRLAASLAARVKERQA